VGGGFRNRDRRLTRRYGGSLAFALTSRAALGVIFFLRILPPGSLEETGLAPPPIRCALVLHVFPTLVGGKLAAVARPEPERGQQRERSAAALERHGERGLEAGNAKQNRGHADHL